MSHTPTMPTELYEYEAGLTEEQAARALACVQGCAGLNPAAYRECVEALKDAEVVLRTRKVDRRVHHIVIEALAHAQEVG